MIEKSKNKNDFFTLNIRKLVLNPKKLRRIIVQNTGR